MAFYDPSVLEIHVLLVDNDATSLRETADMLQVNSYKVTSVHEISVASSLLSQGNTKFDIVMVDVNSADLQTYKLIHDAINMDLTVILMAAEVNPILVKCAIEDGAFLFIQKPATMDVLKYLWQYVLREKTRKKKENRRCEQLIRDNQKHQPGGENWERNLINDDHTMKLGDGPKNIRIEDCDSDNNIDYVYKGRKPKMCIEWTQELHGKFMDAVKRLGEGKCFPKEILELMKVPGLTRMQVASHLQKCRTGWQTPRLRQPRNWKKSSSSQRSTPKKYGLFPHLIRGSQPKFPRQEDKIDKQVPSGTSEDSVQNIGQHGTFENYVSNNSNDNSNENVHGNLFAGAPNQVVPNSDAFFDLAAGNEGLFNGNNFDLQDFDLDQAFPEDQVYNVANEEAQVFWNSWVSTFSSD